MTIHGGVTVPVMVATLALASDGALDTTWACTVETLRSGQTCTFEGHKAPARDPQVQSKNNHRALAAVAQALCGDIARVGPTSLRSKETAALCQGLVMEEGGPACLDPEHALADDRGRFVPQAQECYQALAHILGSLRTQVARASGCCECVVSACEMLRSACYELVGPRSRGKALPACAVKACAEECEVPAPPPATTEDRKVVPDEATHRL